MLRARSRRSRLVARGLGARECPPERRDGRQRRPHQAQHFSWRSSMLDVRRAASSMSVATSTERECTAFDRSLRQIDQR